MKTRICRLHAKGDLRIEEIEVGEPGPGEVLIAMGAGGICGSDLHYYLDGGFGPIRVREPIILGHEVAGTVSSLGPDVQGLAVGDRVAINPSRPCQQCRYCREGLQQHCLTMRFFGSALRSPHEQGGFRDLMVVDAFQCVRIGNPEISLGEAACAEPLAVCLHALNRAGAAAGNLAGKSALVTGAGPIGALVVAALRQAGAGPIVVTDLQDGALETASRMGADETINVGTDSDPLDAYGAGKGTFDIVFECSAAGPAIRAAIAAIRPQGTLVEVGVAGDVAVPLNLLVGKEIAFVGTHRFVGEYAEAVRLIDTRRIDVRPIISATLDLEEAAAAFEMAADRTRFTKVQLSFAT
ncbi:L-idonate 5-dehydrogenase [Mesorhizobium sp. YIM 152430]|uniref:L-idonate 5-dehydrogenase n=1 Tax=Mesorhizobium sp. YIM 152430 TaxID=3031761 RepID=UPI0023DB4731|nr:L-idonate 5-dehydrogenase [Mesorhizobium sp. YIM 152430]MDF1601793.1 L-idonate 5-dehydrogenase [Mesorhizobium sp. YIM 152430]